MKEKMIAMTLQPGHTCYPCNDFMSSNFYNLPQTFHNLQCNSTVKSLGVENVIVARPVQQGDKGFREIANV